MWGSEDTRNVYAGLNSKKPQEKAGWLKPVATAAGAAGGFLVGGPAGAMAGAQLGGAAGGVAHDAANGAVTPEGLLGEVGQGVAGFNGLNTAMDTRSIIEAFMRNPHAFRVGFANGGLVTGPTMDLASQWAQMDPVQRAMLQAQQAVGNGPVYPTVENGQIGALQQAKHPTLEALLTLLPQIAQAIPRPAVAKNTKAIGAWAPAASLALSAPAVVAQARRAGANAPIEARNLSRQEQYAKDKAAHESRVTTLSNTLVGNATKPFAEQAPKEEGPMVDIPGVGRVSATSGLGGDRIRKMHPEMFPESASQLTRNDQQTQMNDDAETAAEEIASLRGDPSKIATSSRYPGFMGRVTALVNQKLKERGSPYTLQELQKLNGEANRFLTVNNQQRMTAMRQAAVTVRKHIRQMRGFYNTYGTRVPSDRIRTVGKTKFDMALEGYLGDDAQAAASELDLAQEFVAGEAAVLLSAGYAPHVAQQDAMRNKLQVASRSKKAGKATIAALEDFMGARIRTALEATPYSGCRSNPYLLEPSPLQGWEEAGAEPEAAGGTGGKKPYKPKSAVPLGGN